MVEREGKFSKGNKNVDEIRESSLKNGNDFTNVTNESTSLFSLI